MDFVSCEGISKWFIFSVPPSAQCQKHSSVSPHRPHYPLNFQLFQRQMSTPGIQANLSMMNTGDRAISTPLTGDKWAGEQTFFFLFLHISTRLQFQKGFLPIAAIFLSFTVTRRVSWYLAMSCHLWATLKEVLPRVSSHVYRQTCSSGVQGCRL